MIKKFLSLMLVFVFMQSSLYASPASLQFTSGSSQLICSTFPSLSNFTWELWFNPDSFAASDRLITKITNTGGTVHSLNFSASSVNNFTAGMRQVTTNLTYTTSDANTRTGQWYYVGLTYQDQTAGRVKICMGSTTVNCIERTYSTATDGSGNLLGDDLHSLYIGSREGLTQGFNGRIAAVRISSGSTTIPYMQDGQWQVTITSQTVGLWVVGTSTGVSDSTIRLKDLTGHGYDCYGKSVTESGDSPPINFGGIIQ